jgi:hypothetical protein
MPKGQKKQVVKKLEPYTMTIGPSAKPGTIAADVRLGRNIAANPELLGTSKGKPCNTARKGCPIQLVFKRDVPYLRLCGVKGKPGKLVEAGTPQQAYDRAKELCACWNANDKSFDRCAAPDAPLGAAKRGRKKTIPTLE